MQHLHVCTQRRDAQKLATEQREIIFFFGSILQVGQQMRFGRSVSRCREHILAYIFCFRKMKTHSACEQVSCLRDEQRRSSVACVKCHTLSYTRTCENKMSCCDQRRHVSFLMCFFDGVK